MEIDSPFGIARSPDARSPRAPPSAERGGRRVPAPSARTLERADGDGTGKKSATVDVNCPDPRDARSRNFLLPRWTSTWRWRRSRTTATRAGRSPRAGRRSGWHGRSSGTSTTTTILPSSIEATREEQLGFILDTRLREGCHGTSSLCFFLHPIEIYRPRLQLQQTYSPISFPSLLSS